MPIVRTGEDTRIRGGPAAWLALLARALRPAARAFRAGSPRGAVRDAETASPPRLGGFTFLVPGLWEGPAPPQAPADPPDPGPFVVVSRVPRADLEAVASPAPSILYPGVHWWSRDPERPRAATAPPGVVVGPPAGPIRSIDRELAATLRHFGIASSQRPDMLEWLTVTSAWLGPLRGAVVAAARQGRALAACPDLLTVAARAVRERISLLKAVRLPLDVRPSCILFLPEWWAVGEMRGVAAVLTPGVDLRFLPTAAEAAAVSAGLARRYPDLDVRSPAADFLDGFSAEEARRNAG